MGGVWGGLRGTEPDGAGQDRTGHGLGLGGTGREEPDWKDQDAGLSAATFARASVFFIIGASL